MRIEWRLFHWIPCSATSNIAPTWCAHLAICVRYHCPLQKIFGSPWFVSSGIQIQENLTILIPQSGKPNSWIAEFETPLKPESPISLLVEIDQNHTNPGHTLGCFRLSGTSGKVTLDPKLEHPADIQAVLAIAAEKRSDAQIAKLLSHYRTIIPQLANIRSKIEATKKERTNTENAHTRSYNLNICDVSLSIPCQ